MSEITAKVESIRSVPKNFLPVLPAYQKFPDAKVVEDCGCFTYGRPAMQSGPSKFLPGPLKRTADKIADIVEHEILAKFLNLGLRTPIFFNETEEPPTGKVKLNKKIDQAYKNAKHARKDARKAEKKARKAKGKAEKLVCKAVVADRMFKDAKDTTNRARDEIDQAEKIHGSAVRWSAALGQRTQKAKRSARETLTDAGRVYDRMEYCDHLVIRA